MRVIMLSTDSTVLRPESSAALRMVAYGTIFDSVQILVSGTGHESRVTLSDNVTVIRPGGATKVINFFRLWYYSRTVPADIISAQDPLWTGLIAVLSDKKRVQVQLHTDTFGFLGTFLMPFVLKRASCVRVVSEKIASMVREYTNAPVSVLPIFVDKALYQSPRPLPPEYGPEKRVLVVSRLAPEKRVHLTIEAFSKIRDAHLYIVGDGPLRARLASLASRLGIQDRVHFLGWKHDVVPYYQHADCFVLVSSFEGYGMALVEAALAGCPIVSTNVGIARALPQSAVTIVEPEQYALVSALTRALATDTKDAARAASEKLSNTMPTFQEYLATYQRIMTTCGI